ncbi:UNVERIFIED_CONTAM: hypothetical protein Sradi_5429600 [Sesamum radiatum]|uniref:Uncharacterized protein n=1 Tax=Sesamum radiatum TaxID=300843 RepID=A0AAW2L8Y8_SESRA
MLQRAAVGAVVSAVGAAKSAIGAAKSAVGVHRSNKAAFDNCSWYEVQNDGCMFHLTAGTVCD